VLSIADAAREISRELLGLINTGLSGLADRLEALGWLPGPLTDEVFREFVRPTTNTLSAESSKTRCGPAVEVSLHTAVSTATPDGTTSPPHGHWTASPAQCLLGRRCAG
jgi:hypothetical protein